MKDGMDAKAKLITVENNELLLSVAKQQLADERIDFTLADGYEWIDNYKGEPFDLIFADPPYDNSPGDFLAKLPELKILKPDGVLVFETRKQPKQPTYEGELFLELLRDKTYGDTRIQLFRKKSS